MKAKFVQANEGFSSHPYPCSEGKLTIGNGWNLDAGISEELAEIVLLYQIGKIEDQLQGFGFWNALNEARQTVLVDMVFQLGWAGFSKFKNTINALHHQDYCTAAIEIIDSKYAKQTPERAERNADIMAMGEIGGKASCLKH